MGVRPASPVFTLLTPLLILVGIFVVFPFFFNIVVTFSKWIWPSPPEIPSLYSIMEMLTDPYFYITFKNSLVMLLIVPLAIGMGLLFAVLLTNPLIVGRSILRSLVAASMAIPPVVIGITWLLALDPQAGIYNKILQALGLPPRAYIYDPETGVYAIIFAAAWAWTGFTTTVFIANMESIPRELYEAALIDGADSRTMFFTITLPLLKPAFTINVVMTTIYALKLFDIVYVFGAEAPILSITPLSYYMYYVMMFRYDWGYAAAISTVLTAIVLVFAYATLRKIARWE